VQIAVSLSCAATVEVQVRNLAGRPVAALPPQDLSAGVGTLLWNGRSPSGTTIPAGTYLVQVTACNAGGGQRQVLAPLSLRR
jgi:flagellar hook assembly protein FlgD